MVARFDTTNVWTSFLVSSKFLSSLGLKSDVMIKNDGDDYVYTGISIINASKITDLGKVVESYVTLDDKRIAFNLNTNEDYRLLNTF